jgi:hypothetical protein
MAAIVLSALDRREPRQLPDVRPGDERLGPGARDDQAPQRRVGSRRLDGGRQFLEDVRVESIQLVGPVDREDPDRLRGLGQDEVAHHAFPPYS